MIKNCLLGLIAPLLLFTPYGEAVSFEQKPHEFEMEEFEYVYDKLQELIDEVQGLKEQVLPQKLTHEEWQELLFPESEPLEALESTQQSTYSD